MIEAAHRIGTCFHFMSAWQVFAMSRWHQQWILQWHGCFSVNREANDLAAFKTAIELLRTGKHPLVIFPEGDIYHSNDRVTPFRDGAAAIAMSAAKKSDRKIYFLPAALKCFYTRDPTAKLLVLTGRLEESLHWRPRTDLPLDERIYRIAGGLLTLKELEYLDGPRVGSIKDRIAELTHSVLSRLEVSYQVRNPAGFVTERVKELRRAVIQQAEQADVTEQRREQLNRDMDDLFFVIQLFSYPGDYLQSAPSIERIAETLDKFDEDVLRSAYPSVHGERRVVVRFGEPLEVPAQRSGRDAVAEWTNRLESSVQSLLDQTLAENSAVTLSAGSPTE